MKEEKDKILFAENIGKSIIKHQYEHYKKNSLDDEEIIPMLKAVINGISEQLISEGFTITEIKKIVYELKQFSKDIYIAEWIKNGEEGEDIAKAKKEGEKYFNYLLKYGKHPNWNPDL